MANTVDVWDETNDDNDDADSAISLVGSTSSLRTADNNMRAIMGAIARWTGFDTIASATTTNLASVEGIYVQVTGTTTITGLGTCKAGWVKILEFAAALTFTHNGTSLILPAAANITTAAGDVAIMVSEGSGNWRCANYMRAASSPFNPTFATVTLSGGQIAFPATQNASADANTLDDYEEGTWTPVYSPSSGGFGSVTYDSGVFGRYTKIGRLAAIGMYMETDAITVGTAADNANIGGLPFTVGAGAAMALVRAAAFAGDYPRGGYAQASSTIISLWYRSSVNGADLQLQVSDLDTGSSDNRFFLAGAYSI